MKYEDIHLEDKSRWNQFQKKWNEQNYQSALSTALYSVFLNKRLDATSINDITSELLKLQKQGDVSFKTDKIVVSSEPPADLADGKVYFRLIGPVTDYNEQNAYYIEINQKTSSGYDVLNPATQADEVALTTNTSQLFGVVSYKYSIDEALYNTKSLLNNY